MEGESVDAIGVTVGGSQHYRCVPLMPEMGWLGEAHDPALAGAHEIRRRRVIESALADVRHRLDVLARDFDTLPLRQRDAAVAAMNVLQRQEQVLKADLADMARLAAR